MKPERHIKNLDTLEKEIYRLKLRKMELEKRLGENVEYLQKHYASMTMHSVFSRSGHHEKGEESGRSWIRGKMGRVLDQVVDHLFDRAADSIERVVERFFQKKDAKS